MHCQYCESFDLDQLAGETGYKHHTNWQALRLSAAQGCAICTLATENARECRKYEDDGKWRSLEELEQVYCSLDDGVIYWSYGDIQRSVVLVCVEGKFISFITNLAYALIACYRSQCLQEPHSDTANLRVCGGPPLYGNDEKLA